MIEAYNWSLNSYIKNIKIFNYKQWNLTLWKTRGIKLPICISTGVNRTARLVWLWRFVPLSLLYFLQSKRMTKMKIWTTFWNRTYENYEHTIVYVMKLQELELPLDFSIWVLSCMILSQCLFGLGWPVLSSFPRSEII